jgi:hypothetical protein
MRGFCAAIDEADGVRRECTLPPRHTGPHGWATLDDPVWKVRIPTFPDGQDEGMSIAPRWIWLLGALRAAKRGR